MGWVIDFFIHIPQGQDFSLGGKVAKKLGVCQLQNTQMFGF